MQGGSEEKKQGGWDGRSEGREAVWERVRCSEGVKKRDSEGRDKGAKGEGARHARTEGRERDREKRKEKSKVLTKINE